MRGSGRTSPKGAREFQEPTTVRLAQGCDVVRGPPLGQHHMTVCAGSLADVVICLLGPSTIPQGPVDCDDTEREGHNLMMAERRESSVGG